MNNEERKQASRPGDPHEAEPGRGAPGSQWGVQMAQNIDVNAKDEVIPANTDVQENIKNIKAEAKQEEGTGLPTTHGYTLDESGRIDNFAVEPPMYVEGEDPDEVIKRQKRK